MADLTANATKIMELVEGLTIVELADLVSAMEEKFGVSAAGGQKIAVIKVIREITGLGLAEAKALADNGGNVKENVKKDEADKIKADLEAAGATIEIK